MKTPPIPPAQAGHQTVPEFISMPTPGAAIQIGFTDQKVSAYSRRKAFGGDVADRAWIVIFGEMAQVVGGGEVAPVGLLLAPVDEQAVGPAGEGAVHVHAVAFAQAAAVVVA